MENKFPISTDPDDRHAQDIDQFYRRAMAEAHQMRSGQFFGQMLNERDWEKARRPYYNLWPSIVPMLTRLNLDLDSDLIRLPLPVPCIRFPKDPAKNPLRFDWKGDEVRRPLHPDGGHQRGDRHLGADRHWGGHGRDRRANLHLSQLPPQAGPDRRAILGRAGHEGLFADIGILVPDSLVMDCVRLCCSLCLLENDPEIISPDVLADDRAKYDQRRPEVRGQGPSPGQGGLGCGPAHRSYPALPPTAHGLGLDGTGAGAPKSCRGKAASSIGRRWKSCRVDGRARCETTFQEPLWRRLRNRWGGAIGGPAILRWPQNFEAANPFRGQGQRPRAGPGPTRTAEHPNATSTPGVVAGLRPVDYAIGKTTLEMPQRNRR